MIKDFFKGFKEGMTQFGIHISNIVNFILLSIVYIFGIGIVSLIAKVSNKHFLELNNKNDTSKKSLWKIKNLTTKEKNSYYRMF